MAQPYGMGRRAPSRQGPTQLHHRWVVAFGHAFRHAACDNRVEDYEPGRVGQQGHPVTGLRF